MKSKKTLEERCTERDKAQLKLVPECYYSGFKDDKSSCTPIILPLDIQHAARI
jgi:hypothetical protein